MQESTIGVKVNDPFLICALSLFEIREADMYSEPLDNIKEVHDLLLKAWSMINYSTENLPSDIGVYFVNLMNKGVNTHHTEISQVKLSTMVSVIQALKVITLHEQNNPTSTFKL